MLKHITDFLTIWKDTKDTFGHEFDLLERLCNIIYLGTQGILLILFICLIKQFMFWSMFDFPESA